jgi:Tol biopolymer transport system component
MQPAISADGNRLVAVKRALNRSDLYVLRTNGQAILQLTHDQSATVEANHWVFYPRFGPDGSIVYFSYDAKDPYNSYRVDLAIFAASAEDPSSQGVQWTEPNRYTGGDVAPIPLQKGALIYTKFSIDDKSNVHSQVWLQARRGSAGVALTNAADDCAQPAVTRDETQLAMVCRHGGLQAADLEIASLEGSTLGTPSVVVHDQLVASPAFSPDGKLLAYLAPAGDAGPFQLWTVPVGAAGTPAPRRITSNLDLDPTSSPVWTSS